MVSPFDTLPNELVSMILKEAIETYAYQVETIFVTLKTDMDILASILLVCKRWTYIILNEAVVWASAIDVDYGDLVSNQQFARLAKRLPLVILSDRDDPEAGYEEQLFETPNWQYVFTLIERWGVFSLSKAIDVDNMDPLVDGLTQPAPNLESFQINSMLYIADLDEQSVADLNSELFVLPDNLFAGQSPRLKRFAITDAYLRSTFDFSVWTHVTELYVRLTLGGLQGDKISSRKWLEVLRQMKQLQILSLGWTYSVGFDHVSHLLQIDSEQDPEIGNVADVHLDHLHSLILLAECEWNIMFNIFPKLIVPDACSTTVTLRHFHEREVPFGWLTIGLDRRVTGWEAATTPLYVSLEKDIGFEFGFRIHSGFFSGHMEDYNFEFTHKVCSHPFHDQELCDPFANFPAMVRMLQPYMESSSTHISVLSRGD